MEGFRVILHNILLLACMIAIGFAAFRSGYFAREVNAAISKVVVRISLPALIISSLTKVSLTRERLFNCLFVILAAAIVIGVLFLAGGLLARLFSLPPNTAFMHQCMTALGNVGFLGYPLMLALYGEEGLFYAALYGFVNDLIVWTFVVFRLAKQKNGSSAGIGNLKNMLNPPTVAFLAAFLLLIFGIRPSGFVGELLNGFGNTTTYLSMLFIGGTLAGADLKQLFRGFTAFFIVAVKMLIAPFLVMLLIRNLPFDPVAKGALVMQIAVPCQTVLSVLTGEYGGDTEYVVKGIFITTLFGLATMPFIYYLFSIVM